MLLISSDYITKNDDFHDVCAARGVPVGALVWNSKTQDFEQITADEYNARIKEEQAQRLEKEGATYKEYEGWANGWDWNMGYNIYHGDTRDKRTLDAFLSVVRKRELDKAVSEYRSKCKAASRAPVLASSRSRSRSVRRAGRHVSRSFVPAGFDSGGDDGGGDGDGQSDSHRVAAGRLACGVFGVASARFRGLTLNSRINSTATRKRALPALFGARCGGRVFCAFSPVEVAA